MKHLYTRFEPAMAVALLLVLSAPSCNKEKEKEKDEPAPKPDVTQVKDIDGNVYQTITIGTQVWMKENLKTTRYRDSSEIYSATDDVAWEGLVNKGAWCWYENNSIYDSTYGKLYNWYATADPRGLCPVGWHVPTDADWLVLIDHLGGPGVAGDKMKAIDGWNEPNTEATNSSGFTGLPGGYRYDFGLFYSVGYYGFWWSSTESSHTSISNPWVCLLVFDNNIVLRDWYYGNKQKGFSVRCMKD